MPKIKTIAAFLAGALLAGLPVMAFKIWVGDFIAAQGEAQARRVADGTIALAEYRISQAMDMLDAIASRGVASCRSDHLDMLRSANFSAGAVKEFSLVGPDGQTLCSDLGVGPGERAVLGAVQVASRREVTVELVQTGHRRERFLRLRRPAVSGPNSIAALIPPQLLAPVGRSVSYTRLTVGGDLLLADIGQPIAAADNFAGSSHSTMYGLNAAVFYLRAANDKEFRELVVVGYLITGLIAAALFAFAILSPRRRVRDNPVATLERAIKAGEFVPYYQPVLDITTGRVRGAEVLVRWRKPDGTVVAPGHFIPLAESSGLIFEMTRRIMRAARDEVGAALADRPSVRIGFNLAARQFTDDGIVADVRDIFERSPMRMNQLILEVTERQHLDNLTAARRVIAALQGLGVRIAIDDIGAGHSGLSYMLKLGVDIIKIDKIFIDALCHDSNSITIIETLIDLAHNMRMEVVAEGVETFDQVVALRERGICIAQGYAFAPPLPGASFLQLLEALEPVSALPPARETPLIALGRRAVR